MLAQALVEGRARRGSISIAQLLLIVRLQTYAAASAQLATAQIETCDSPASPCRPATTRKRWSSSLAISLTRLISQVRYSRIASSRFWPSLARREEDVVALVGHAGWSRSHAAIPAESSLACPRKGHHRYRRGGPQLGRRQHRQRADHRSQHNRLIGGEIHQRGVEARPVANQASGIWPSA